MKARANKSGWLAALLAAGLCGAGVWAQPAPRPVDPAEVRPDPPPMSADAPAPAAPGAFPAATMPVPLRTSPVEARIAPAAPAEAIDPQALALDVIPAPKAGAARAPVLIELPPPIELPAALAEPAAADGAILLEPGTRLPAPAVSAADLEAYVDGLVPSALARGGLAGAVVVVVRDGRTLLSKGYGYADLARRRPMDPARTLVRPGSVSKLFVWTAVMQLVEQGRLDLDADVNRYLDFRIRDYAGQPATLRQLMTHSAGFEESTKHLFARDAAHLQPLGRYLREVQPQRIYPPGRVPAYSNYGAALAGYIVQRVSGLPFDDYVERRILAPLGMRHSSFRQPLPKGLAADLAQGYATAGGPPIGFEYVNPAPAGSLSATAQDMAAFMNAQLGAGRYGDAVLLQPHSVQRLHAANWRPIAGLDAIGLGFFRRDGRGPLAIGHGGATEAFQSMLVLLPEHGVGLFVSASGPGRAGRALHRDLVDGVIRRYFPSPAPARPTLATARLHGEQIAGHYENSRSSASNFLAIARLLGGASIRVHDDATVSVSTLRTTDGRPKRWREVGPYLWQEVGGDSLLAAKLRGQQVIAVSSDDVPAAMWLQPVPAWRSPAWVLPVLGLAFALQLAAVVLWPVAALVRRHLRRGLGLDARALRWRRWLQAGVVANVALVSLWAWILARIESSVRMLDGGLDGWLRLAQALGLMSVATATVAVLYAHRLWRSPPHRLRRACAVAIALACAATVWAVFALKTVTPALVY
ncbi:serine hydrolase domain-containing protein [Lysobacter antibioticus]|uniref:serine hydrolase domain-containing protein n=1 Tax=Lysobacter antibioticus TaxID=84531 RepID=UPI00034A88C8|nr:serine hydrolase domain-containing protein [Lysobacter antibioticus]